MAKPSPKFIRGPSSLVQLESKGLDKTLLLFGDHHTPKSNCTLDGTVDIDQFIEDEITQDPTRNIDVVLEFDYFRGKDADWKQSSVQYSRDQDGFLMWNTANRFKGYIDKTGNTTKFNNARFHMIDARSLFPPKSALFAMRVASNLARQEVIRDPIQFLNNSWPMGLVDPNKPTEPPTSALVKLRTLEFDELWGCCKGSTEFDRLIDDQRATENMKKYFKTCKDTAKDFFKARFDRRKKLVLDFFDTAPDFKLPSDTRDQADLIGAIFNIPSIVMDIYTTARLLKPEFKNIIVYVGDEHAFWIQTFLLLPNLTANPFGFRKKFDARSEKTIKCIDLKNAPLPFFSSNVKEKDVNMTDVKHTTSPNLTINGEPPVSMDTSPDDDTFYFKTRSRPILRPGNDNDVNAMHQTQADLIETAKGDVARRARMVVGLDNKDLQLPFWPLYHLDNQKATEYRPGDRLAVRIILPDGNVDIVKMIGQVVVQAADEKKKDDKKTEVKTTEKKTEAKTDKRPEPPAAKKDDDGPCITKDDKGNKFRKHDCIEVFLIGEIQFVHPKDPLLNGEGVLYKLIPKQVVVTPPEFQKYVVENFVPDSKYLGVPIVYWLGVYDDLMSATIFVTSAYKTLQQIVDDIGQENLDPTTRMGEYDVLAIRRSRTQGRFGIRESQIKINPIEFLGKENPLPSAYGKTIVERAPTKRTRMSALEEFQRKRLKKSKSQKRSTKTKRFH